MALIHRLKQPLIFAVYVFHDQESVRNFTQNCIIEDFPYLLEAIFCMITCIILHRKVGLKRTSPRSRREWGSCEHKQVEMVEHSTKKQKWTLLGTQEKNSETSVKKLRM